MPGFNGSGPMGNGSMTGGGRGLCNSGDMRFGRGGGRRRGFDRNFDNQPVYDQTGSDELNTLKSEVASIKSMLETLTKAS